MYFKQEAVRYLSHLLNLSCFPGGGEVDILHLAPLTPNGITKNDNSITN
jgi:hypothetical protein